MAWVSEVEWRIVGGRAREGRRSARESKGGEWKSVGGIEEGEWMVVADEAEWNEGGVMAKEQKESDKGKLSHF